MYILLMLKGLLLVMKGSATSVAACALTLKNVNIFITKPKLSGGCVFCTQVSL